MDVQRVGGWMGGRKDGWVGEWVMGIRTLEHSTTENHG